MYQINFYYFKKWVIFKFEHQLNLKLKLKAVELHLNFFFPESNKQKFLMEENINLYLHFHPILI